MRSPTSTTSRSHSSKPHGDGTTHVNGRIRIDELNDLLGTDLPAGDWDTAAGLLCALGHIPAAGETASQTTRCGPSGCAAAA